jgi:hypothetical protein
MRPFSGSYATADVEFLLKTLELAPVEDIEEKERLIQSGKKHYSEMIGVEQQPDQTYLELFHQSMESNLAQMGEDLYWITRKIREARNSEELAIVSLARAGTPIGVGIKRLLEAEFNTSAKHYSISIIRDRGIDEQALRHITARHSPESMVVVDGWTGKGAIATELHASMSRLTEPPLQRIPKELYVLCDLGGVSTDCGSTEDYLIPSAILNSTVSGLVSRTILNELIGPSDFHGCLYYKELESRDLSRWFIERLLDKVTTDLPRLREAKCPKFEAIVVRKRMSDWLEKLRKDYGIQNSNLIKPGICESTRALLRRSARLLLVQDRCNRNTNHLVHLAVKNNIPIEVRGDMPFMATVLIRSFAHG